MTVDELRAEVQRRRAQGQSCIVMVVPGARRGARCRVFPGVMGRVLGCANNGVDTVCDVRLDDIERALRTAEPKTMT